MTLEIISSVVFLESRDSRDATMTSVKQFFLSFLFISMLLTACQQPIPQADFVSAVKLKTLYTDVFVNHPITIRAVLEGQLIGKPGQSIDEIRRMIGVTWEKLSGQGTLDAGLSLAQFIPALGTENSSAVFRATSIFDPSKSSTITINIKALPPLGLVETQYGTNGQRVIRNLNGATDFQSSTNATTQWNDEIVTAGYSYLPGLKSFGFGLTRITNGGEPDTKFNGNGTVIVDFAPNSSVAQSVTTQPDGKIIAVGKVFTSNTTSDLALVRLNSDGSLDSSFGVAGKQQIDFGEQENGNRVALQKDGKILVGGTGSKAFLARLNTDGTLDLSFNKTGRVLILDSNSDQPRWGIGGLVIQSDGKIVVAGDLNLKRFVVRLNQDGQTDLSFDPSGFSNENERGDISALELTTTGKLVIASTKYLFDASFGVGDTSIEVTRLTNSGQLDTTFGLGGHSNTNLDLTKSGRVGIFFSSNSRALKILDDDSILVAGIIYPQGGTAINADVGLLKFSNNGDLVKIWTNDFGSEPVLPNYVNDLPRGIHLRSDGKIFVVSEIFAGFQDDFFGGATGLTLFQP
jgi:uncharacterized delta-60 repeat protein